MAIRNIVFISSTTSDLAPYRNAAIQVCQWLETPPIVMERLSDEQRFDLDFYRARVQEASLYLGIFAYRYGWQPPQHAGKSIVELEYEWAKAKPMPALIYLVDEKWRWPPDKMDFGDEGQKLQAFKQHLKQVETVQFFRSVKRFRRDLLRRLEKGNAGLPLR